MDAATTEGRPGYPLLHEGLLMAPPFPHALLAICLAWIGACVGAGEAVLPPRILPGQRDDGSVLLPNQWSLSPAGRQVELADFPVNIAVHPRGRYAAVLHCGYARHEI